jgi:hypothetical protein
MPITETDWTELVQRSDLTPIEDGWSAGRVRDFPVAIKIMVSDEATVFLAQIRLSKKIDSSFSPALTPDSKLAPLIANQTADLSFDRTLAWLTLTNPPGDITEVRQVLEEFLAALARAGLAGTPACYYCGVKQVQNLKFYDGRVVQICDPCLERRLKNGPQAKVVDLVPLGIVALLAGFAGALAWALVWLGWNQLFIVVKTESIRLPWVLMILLAVCIALVTAGPAGWIIQRIPSRTALTGSLATVSAALLALFLGELLYMMILIYKQFSVIAPSVALRLLPRTWSEDTPPFKLIAGGMTFLLALGLALDGAKKAKLDP